MKTIPSLAVLLLLSTAVFAEELKKLDAAAKRLATLKANVKDFQLGLSYGGEYDKPYYRLLLSVPKVNVKQSDAFFLMTQLSEEQALKIIAHLAETGAIDRASEKGEMLKWPEPSYRLAFGTGDLQLSVSLGWGKDMLKSMDGLRIVLDGNAAKEMDTLLGRLSGHRREWDAAEQKEIERLNRYYPNGFHFVDTLRADGKILWITQEVIGGSVKSQRREIKTLEDFKKAFLKANVSKEASIEVHVRSVQIEGATKRAEAILEFLQAEGFTQVGAVSN